MLIALVLAAAVALTGCGATSHDSQTTHQAPPADSAQGESEVGADAGADAGSGAADEGEAGEAQRGEDNRQVITTGRVAVEVDDTSQAVAEVVERLAAYDGVVENRLETAGEDGEPVYASLSLRVPAESFADLVGELDELGDVVERSESSRDVTGAVEDLDARIGALETSTERLLEIMEESETSADLLEAETTLSERQAELEALEAERAGLADQVAMSTLELEISSEPIAGVEGGGFLGGLQQGWRGLVEGLNFGLITLGVLLPWLPVLALPVIAAAWLVRRLRRRRRQQR